MIVRPVYHFFNKSTRYLIVFFVVFSIFLPGYFVVEIVETENVHHEILISNEMPDSDIEFETVTDLLTECSCILFPNFHIPNLKKNISIITVFPDDILFPPPESIL